MASAAASAPHVAIIIGGPAWYRFFGAGERMARLAARGSTYPAVLTMLIAGVLAVWAAYGFSGAGVIRPLPQLRPVLFLIAGAYGARGVLGIPFVVLTASPYARELRGRMWFMVPTSLVCILLSAGYAVGAAGLRSPASARPIRGTRDSAG